MPDDLDYEMKLRRQKLLRKKLETLIAVSLKLQKNKVPESFKKAMEKTYEKTVAEYNRSMGIEPNSYIKDLKHAMRLEEAYWQTKIDDFDEEKRKKR